MLPDDIPGEPVHTSGHRPLFDRLLDVLGGGSGQLTATGPIGRRDRFLPLLQIYDSFEYLLALKRHQDGRIEQEEVWVSDDPCDGRCLPVNPRSEEEIRDDLRRFFADDPRAETFVRESPLR